MKLMQHKITLLPGDGIGPEVSAAVLRIIDAAGVKMEWERFIVGGEAHDRLGTSLPDSVIESVRRNRIALKGPVATPIGTGFESVNVRLRKALDLYANLRPVRNLPGVESRFGDVDLIIVRENTEGLYSGLEHEVVPGVVESLKIMTEKACTRISVFAFEYARKYGRKKVTAVHKANIMKKSDGLCTSDGELVRRYRFRPGCRPCRRTWSRTERKYRD
jgi:isocitrate dehydrogenase (NAD+)